MKPSERIDEIKKEISSKDPFAFVNAMGFGGASLDTQAVIIYLDEQYEKDKKEIKNICFGCGKCIH